MIILGSIKNISNQVDWFNDLLANKDEEEIITTLDIMSIFRKMHLIVWGSSSPIKVNNNFTTSQLTDESRYILSIAALPQCLEEYNKELEKENKNTRNSYSPLSDNNPIQKVNKNGTINFNAYLKEKNTDKK